MGYILGSEVERGRLSPAMAGDYHRERGRSSPLQREIITTLGGRLSPAPRLILQILGVYDLGDQSGRLSPGADRNDTLSVRNQRREIITSLTPSDDFSKAGDYHRAGDFFTREKGGRLSPVMGFSGGIRRREIITGRVDFHPGGQSGRLSPVHPRLALRVPGLFFLSVTRHEKSSY